VTHTPKVPRCPPKKMDIYDLYKPFRNQLRKLALRPSLERIWAYQRNTDVAGMVRLPIRGGQWFELYTWGLHLLCREIMLHADGNDDTLSTIDGLLSLVNHVRRIDEQISGRIVNSERSAMEALHPRIHQQARWQNADYGAAIFRAFHIYATPEITPIFEQATGATVQVVYTLAMILGGAAKRHAYTSPTQDYSAFGVSATMRDAFFQRIAATSEQIREELRALQRYDETWAYTWNALEKYPLIRLNVSGTPGLCCPLPDLLLRRVTEGLFYDLLNTDKHFGDRYGRAFERYVGLVLSELFDESTFTVVPEQVYMVKKNQKHGVDWIVSDATGNLFLECKARRIGQQAKEAMAGAALEASIDELARVVVQHYRNIDDAVSGLTKWSSNGLPVYPFVVTYEDWYLFAPHVVDLLIIAVRRRLVETGMAPNLIETMPFFVTSIAELEKAGQAIAYLGIRRFCEACSLSAHRHFKLSDFASTEFPNETIAYRPLLQESWQAIFSHIPHVLE
jgi:hypothetical protein